MMTHEDEDSHIRWLNTSLCMYCPLCDSPICTAGEPYEHATAMFSMAMLLLCDLHKLYIYMAKKSINEDEIGHMSLIVPSQDCEDGPLHSEHFWASIHLKSCPSRNANSYDPWPSRCRNSGIGGPGPTGYSV